LADRRVLGRALINLIENALHAMNGQGTLSLAVQPGESPGHVRMSVRDTGPGIADEVRGRLFEPYFSTKSAGTGLGLAIVQRAIQAHDGMIEVETEPGRGTAFHVVLPSEPT
jgi:signal transduction histidine kinase